MKQYIISTNFSSKKLNLVCFEGNKKIQEEEISLSDLKNNIDVVAKKARGTKCPVCWKIFETSCERHGHLNLNGQ